MQNYKPPMLIDGFRLTAPTVDQTIQHIIVHYASAGGGWNHQRSLRSMRHAFDGVDDTEGLISGCLGQGTDAQVDNAKIVEAVLPNILGRNARTFDFKRTYYAVTPSIRCSMGPSFFIVEDGVVKLVYVHARNGNRASLADLAGLATLAKTEILDQDFYGIPSDVEIHYVDKKGKNRNDEVFDLARISEHLVEPPDQTLSRFAQAMIEVDTHKLAGVPKRAEKKKRRSEADEAQTEMEV